MSERSSHPSALVIYGSEGVFGDEFASVPIWTSEFASVSNT